MVGARLRQAGDLVILPYPCLCLCFGFSQMTRTTRFRFTILHLSQIFLTEALTFTIFTCLEEIIFELSNPPHPPLPSGSETALGRRLKGGEGGFLISTAI